MGNVNLKLHAAAGGRASQERRLTLAKLGDLLPPLDSPENAKRRCDLVQRWLLARVISAPVGNAVTRSVEAWLKAEAHSMDLHRLKEMAAQLAEVEAQLKQARRTA